MMSEKHRKTQAGFTLVEVLVATAIFVVIFVAALLIYDRSNRVFKSGMEAADVQQNTRVAFDKVLGDLRMAGFDYDRDGNPSGSAAGVTWQQQADEQIEYAGPTAITLRANFNYETATGPCPTTILTTTPPCEHGREAALELSSGGVFPVVTTGNDEIVTYGLESADSSKNTGQIKYYADVPDRKSYQNEVSAGLTGRAENLVTITGVDLTNNNPPYTLYRYTLDPGVGAVTVVRTPVANGIRSMRFQYYEDPTGVIPLTDLAATPAPVTGAADSTAADRYNPAAPDAIIAVRQIRAKIQSIRLTLIGMNESPDSAYAEPLDSTPKAVFGYSGSTSKNFRQYRLESLIVPRNYGKSGLKEQETVAPGPPTITRICVGYCGLAYIEWDSPVIDATHGSPEDYQILVGTTSTTVTTLALDAGLTNSATVPLSDRTASYYFVVKAVNSFGSQNSAVQGPYSVKNATRPNPPDFSTAVITGGGGANPPALPGHIQLTWQAPTTNASGAISCPFGGGSAAATNVREIKQWIVERAEDAGFTVNKKTRTFTQTPDPITGQVMIDDTVANCVTYYYRVKLIENCPASAEQTSGATTDNDSAFSTSISGQASSLAKPEAPTDLVIDTATSSCTGPPGPCTVKLAWPTVVKDVAAADMPIRQYLLTRVRKSGVTTLATNTVTVIESNATTWSETAGGSVTFTDVTTADPLSAGQSYTYTVQAENTCPSATSPGDPSPARVYPCTFAGGAVTVAMSGALAGDGLSAGTAWLVESGSLGITTASSVTRISAVVNPGGLTLGDTGTGSFTTAAFAWPTLTDGVTYTIVITVSDSGGCTQSLTRYVEDSATNCCLQPVSIEPGLVVLQGASKYMTVRLKNLCSENLTLKSPSLTVTFDAGSLSSGGGTPKLTDVFYPTSLGAVPTSKDTIGANSLTATNSAAPAAALKVLPPDVAGPSDDYTLRFDYGRTFASNPLTNLCIKYSTASAPGTTRTCRIYPAPSTTIDSCN